MKTYTVTLEDIEMKKFPNVEMGDIVNVVRRRPFAFKCVESQFDGTPILSIINSEMGYSINSKGTEDPANFDRNLIAISLDDDLDKLKDSYQNAWYSLPI